jgi:Tfp pilus assembly protein PilO
MKRSQILLSVLGAILIVALFYVLLMQPAREEVVALETQIAEEVVAQAGLTQEIARLRSVRDQAPEVEAELVTGEAIVPRDVSLPSALRQLQLSADDSGVVLQAVTTSRPIFVEDGPEGLAQIASTVQLVGGYFQIVDFLRRIEDPAITPRGVEWTGATLARGEEYPELNVVLDGALYAVIAVPPPPEVETELPTDEDGEPLDPETAEVDPDAENDVTVEEAS